jgi:hypothetical protein
MMRLSKLIPVCATALFASLLSCGVTQTTGGGGTETVNTYAVLLSNGTPASGAVVRILDSKGWLDSVRAGASAIVESTITDKDGRFALKTRDRDSNVNIQVDHSAQGLFLPNVNLGTFDSDNLRLQPYASYFGTLDSSATPLAHVLLSGSAYRASVVNRSFIFNAIAPAAFAVLGFDGTSSTRKVATSGAVTLAPGVPSVDTGLNASFERLLVDNFEIGVGPCFLGRIAPCVYGWYAVSDAGKLDWDAYGSIWNWQPYSSQPTSTCHSFISIDPAPGAGKGTSLEFSAALDSTCSIPYTTFGVAFRGCNPNGIDLSSMTGFSLHARGNGIIWVRFETLVLDSVTNHVSNYSYPIQLTDTWQSLAVPVDSLRILPAIQSPAQHPWSQESKSVIDIEFEFSKNVNPMGDTLHFFLDDFYLNGVGVEAVKP